MSLFVRLDEAEMRDGEEVGLLRSRRSAGRKPRFAYEPGAGSDDQHVLGARGELAFCKALGLVWPRRVDTFRDLPDVDPWWEVRTSPTRYRLKVATDDPPDYRVVHVVGRHGEPGFEVIGFVRAGWAFEKFLPIDLPDRDGRPRNRPAYFLPIVALAPIESWVGR